MGKVIPIRFNNLDLENIKKTEELLGIVDTYGSTVKAVKFCIALAVSTLQDQQNVYFHLDEPNLKLFFQSITKQAIERKRQEKAQKMLQGVQNV